jgi:hypothetical protein
MVENKRNIKDIINEVIDEFLTNEIGDGAIDDSIPITPDMNLGEFSPLQLR